MTGLDGAGKSTLTDSVAETLRDHGHDAVQVYGRYLPRMTYLGIALGRRTLFADSDIHADYEDHQSEKSDLFSNDLLAMAYEGVVMADYVPQFVWRVLRALYTHEIVVCDRYVYDTLLTDLAGDVLDEPADAIERYESYAGVFPTPDHEYYVSIPPEVSMERKDDVPSIEYLEDRKAFYDEFAAAHGLTVLDGTESVTQLTYSVVDEIIDY
jgi:dTMP kinase